MMKGVVICFLVVIAMVQFMAKPGQAAVSCGQVESSLAPCIPFLTERAPQPVPECCTGVRTLKGALTTTMDRQTACNCIKKAAVQFQKITDAAAGALPGKCGTTISVPISRNTDCSKIS